jgi:proline dehydrogenase
MLSQFVPAPLVRFFARPYVAGDSLEAALDVAADLHAQRGLLSSLDLLGEGVTCPEEARRNVHRYERIIDKIADDPRFSGNGARPSVSLKPSAFTAGAEETVREPITALAERANDRGVALTIDMEERRWTNLTLDLAVGLYERGFDVGTVLQTRLFRTPDDLDRIPTGMRLRLVIGIYQEAAQYALTNKRAMKEQMLLAAERLRERGVFVEFGTHDEEFVERFARDIASKSPDRCEVQMLLGVPRARIHHKLMDGDFGTKLPVRIYVPFAIGWDDATAYLRRRMEESPSMIWLVLRNFTRGRVDR